MSLIFLILFGIIIVLFVKVSRLGKNLSLRIDSLYQAQSNLMQRIGTIETLVDAASGEAAAGAQSDEREVAQADALREPRRRWM